MVNQPSDPEQANVESLQGETLAVQAPAEEVLSLPPQSLEQATDRALSERDDTGTTDPDTNRLKVADTSKEIQEKTRSLLARNILIGLGVLLGLIILIDATDRLMMHLLLRKNLNTLVSQPATNQGLEIDEVMVENPDDTQTAPPGENSSFIESTTESLAAFNEAALDLKKEQMQASHSLMTILITASFSALGTALGFYFGNSSRSD
jgi:hypothetical protein